MRTLQIAALAVVPTVALAGPNLIRNGDFEQTGGKLPNVGQHWESNDGAAHSDIQSASTAARHGGKRSLWLKANPKWDLGAVRQVSAYGSVKAGKTYYIQAWIRTANVHNPAGWYVFGVWWFKGDAYLGDSKMPKPASNNYDWRCISWKAVAPPGADRVAAVLTRHTDGDAWYDDIFIGEVGQGPPVLRVSPAALRPHIDASPDASLTEDAITITNTGGSLMKYTVTVDAGWVTIVPPTGASAGNVDTCTIRYHPALLDRGRHKALVTITAPGATRPTWHVGVSATVERRPASRPATSKPGT